MREFRLCRLLELMRERKEIGLGEEKGKETGKGEGEGDDERRLDDERMKIGREIKWK